MRQNETSPETSLTDRQAAALPYLVSSPSLSQGAKLADISRATLYRWMEDSEFRDTLERLRSQAADLALSELQGLMLKGAVVLAEAMEDASPSLRLRAANAALSIGLNVRSLKDFQERLDRVDDAFTLWRKKRPIL